MNMCRCRKEDSVIDFMMLVMLVVETFSQVVACLPQKKNKIVGSIPSIALEMLH